MEWDETDMPSQRAIISRGHLTHHGQGRDNARNARAAPFFSGIRSTISKPRRLGASVAPVAVKVLGEMLLLDFDGHRRLRRF